MPNTTLTQENVKTLAEDVREGLGQGGQKELPSKYFYDALGSALFEAICSLPEYGLSRADERLLTRHSREIMRRLPHNLTVAELGSGSGKKTRILLETLSSRRPLTYYPIEISDAALTQLHLGMSQLHSIRIMDVRREYLDGLSEVVSNLGADHHILVLFLGSTIGNFNRAVGEEFLKNVRALLSPGDFMLLGTDLEKPTDELIRAYDDSLGVTAAFNLNLLARINRELDGEIVLSRFRHEARYNHDERRIEMHIRSTQKQTVTIPRAEIEVSFLKDETIWTESCHKYAPEEVVRIAENAGFSCAAQWIDGEWPFAESLLAAI